MKIELAADPRGGIVVDVAEGSASNAFEAIGLAATVAADGELRLRVDSLACHHLRVRAGAVRLEVGEAVLKGVTARLARPEGARRHELRGLAADELQLQRVTLKASAAVQADGGGIAAGEPWRLAAMSRLDGSLRAFIRDAAWVLDADVHVPVAAGVIDFNRVVVEHLGPNSAMGISRAGLYVDAPNLSRNYLALFAGELPGVDPERRDAGRSTRIADRGRLDLRALAEGLLGRGAGSGPVARAANADLAAALERTRLTGDLQFGDGDLGTATQRVTLTGHGQGKNRLVVSATVLSHRLVLSLPAIAAEGARFAVMGLAGGTGAITAELEAHAGGLGGTAPATIDATVRRLTVHALKLGAVE